MRIATYNAASVRARLPLILDWLAEHEPDVLAIQETKVEDDKFPTAAFDDLGYHVSLNGQKAWNGVATLSLMPPSRVQRGFGDPLFPEDARLIACDVGGLEIVNTYVPNGSAVGSDKFEYKLRWLGRFAAFLRERYRPDQPLLWLGDINIAPTPDDVYDSRKFAGQVGHHPLEFEALRRIVDFGFTDLFRKFHEGPGLYTYWDFVIPRSVERNLGWRIDHLYGTKPVAERCTSCEIEHLARSVDKPSDHTFVFAEINL
ncbi:MAG: exodeoxyribonuclease III [Fimbriimonas ginsengisoli]|uniref:Exodeoxyribonuclease III n=1 Tax=Fimbriimonas ginsengisoli TaxID=1005039 RepID=A0A931LWZ2_FIMGI|nr:exodeoxyribonuclease III [Fimbriimonas ginsengisoli]